MTLNRVWTIFYDNIDLLLSGLLVTIQLSLLAFVISVMVGLLLCLGTISRTRVIRAPAILVVEFCRNTPILVQLVWVHFAWPEILGITLTPWQERGYRTGVAIERLPRRGVPGRDRID